MASIADVFSVVGALCTIVVIPAAYQPIYTSSKTKNYKILLDSDWGNEGDIHGTDHHYILIHLEQTEGDWKFSGELSCSINHDENFVIQGKLQYLNTIKVKVFRTIGWREYEIGTVKIKFDRRTNQCRFIPHTFKVSKLLTDCERAIFNTNLTLWRHVKSLN